MNKTIQKLERYLKKSLIEYSIEEDTLTVNEINYEIIEEGEKLFDEEFEFIPKIEENAIFLFGGRWFTHKAGEEIELNEFRYIGKAVQKLPTKSFLGIHSGYELMNGVGLYKDWIKKAKFLGIEALGICEFKTLRGALLFQNECKKNNIKPIIGMSFPVKGKEEFIVKMYVKDFQGWLNLLKFNYILNVSQKSFISLEELKTNIEGLFLVIDPKSTNFDEMDNLSDIEKDIYFQLDPVEFSSISEDKSFLNNFEKFLKSSFNPISITDAYYLEKEDSVIREQLWSINKSFDVRTKNQYFKNRDQYAGELINMFEKESKHWIKLASAAFENEAYLIENCNFIYDTDTRHLPKYVMTMEESVKYKTNEDLFIGLLTKGFKEKNITERAKYMSRLKTEIDVLKAGNVIDYFLSLHDIIRHAKEKKMLTGIGRGSAGGSLVAYLLGIIQVDPLEFDLLFERFLNSGRMGEYQNRPSYTLIGDDGQEVILSEGALVKILRKGIEKNVFIEDVEEGDELLKY